MPENRKRSAIWPIIPRGYERNRHDGIVDIIGDGLKTEEMNMAETTPATSTQLLPTMTRFLTNSTQFSTRDRMVWPSRH